MASHCFHIHLLIPAFLFSLDLLPFMNHESVFHHVKTLPRRTLERALPGFITPPRHLTNLPQFTPSPYAIYLSLVNGFPPFPPPLCSSKTLIAVQGGGAPCRCRYLSTSRTTPSSHCGEPRNAATTCSGALSLHFRWSGGVGILKRRSHAAADFFPSCRNHSS